MSKDLNPTSPIAQRFLDDLKLGGLSKRTQQAYSRALRKFTEFLGHSPDQASEDDLRRYLLYLVDAKRWASSTINVAQQALKQFYRITCPRDWSVLKLARVQVEQKLPVVISIGEEFRSFVREHPRECYKALFEAAYQSMMKLAPINRALRCPDCGGELVCLGFVKVLDSWPSRINGLSFYPT